MKQKDGRPIVEQYITSYQNKATVQLAPYTEYLFQVLVFNNAGDGPGSSVVGPLRTSESSKFR